MTGNQLKLIAMVTMLIDHLGYLVFPEVRWLRMIGRLAYPIFAYFIFEGSRHTRHRGKYLRRVFVMGLLCLGVSFVATGELYANILITFSCSLVLIYAIQCIIRSKAAREWGRMAIAVASLSVLFLGIVALNQVMVVDYGLWGILTPVLAYLFGQQKEGRSLGAIVGLTLGLLCLAWEMEGIQYLSLVSVALLLLYNGERGRGSLQKVFYWFYPLHFVPLQILAMML